MARINTNIPVMMAQHRHIDLMSRMSQITERLSTGLRINRGSDDPAALIASETLRSEQVAIASAIDNSQRARHFVATADGAMTEISSLLLRLKELTLAGANEGALSTEEIHAHQIEVDDIVRSVDRIATTTQFAGKNLLDGSLSFTTSGTTDALVPIKSVRVNHAQVVDTQPMAVTIKIETEGRHAEQSMDLRRAFYDRAWEGTSTIELSSDQGSKTINMTAGDYDILDVLSEINGSTETTGVEGGHVSGDQIDLQSVNYGTDAELSLKIEEPGGAYWADSASFLNTVEGEWLMRVIGNNGTQYISFDGPQTPADVVNRVNTVTGSTGVHAMYKDGEFSFLSQSVGDSAVVHVQIMPRVYLNSSDSATQVSVNGTPGLPARYDWNDSAGFIAETAGQANSLQVRGSTGTRTISFGPGVITKTDIVNAVNAETGNTGITATDTGGAIRFASVDTGPAALLELAGIDRPSVSWVDQTDFINQAATSLNTLNVAGRLGTRTLNFDTAAYTPTDIVNAVNGVSAQTGVEASLVAGSIVFQSDTYGPNEHVSVTAMHPIPGLATPIDLSERVGRSVDVTTQGGDSATRVVSINGHPATEVNGLYASLDSFELGIDIEFGDFIGMPLGGRDVDGFYVVDTTIYITGGGAEFQLTPNISEHGRINAGIPSMTSNDLGNPLAGYLRDLTATGSKSLIAGQAEQADAIVDAAINQVATLRGELGMIQKSIIEPNISNQQVAYERTTASESSIRDADFAVEATQLSRAQILVQSVGQVLNLANTQTRTALALLG